MPLCCDRPTSARPKGVTERWERPRNIQWHRAFGNASVQNRSPAPAHGNPASRVRREPSRPHNQDRCSRLRTWTRASSHPRSTLNLASVRIDVYNSGGLTPGLRLLTPRVPSISTATPPMRAQARTLTHLEPACPFTFDLYPPRIDNPSRRTVPHGAGHPERHAPHNLDQPSPTSSSIDTHRRPAAGPWLPDGPIAPATHPRPTGPSHLPYPTCGGALRPVAPSPGARTPPIRDTDRRPRQP